jgi:hypothetical protein
MFDPDKPAAHRNRKDIEISVTATPESIRNASGRMPFSMKPMRL